MTTTRRSVEAHLDTCPACTEEVRGFARVRETLAQWAPPDRVGGYRLVRDDGADAPAPGKVLRPARWWQTPVPALARVAAAILLFAGGAALANLDVRYDKERVRRAHRVAPPDAGVAAATAPLGNRQPSRHRCLRRPRSPRPPRRRQVPRGGSRWPLSSAACASSSTSSWRLRARRAPRGRSRCRRKPMPGKPGC